MTNQPAIGFTSNGVSCRIQQAVTFYSASGYRYVGSGAMTDVGVYGYAWSVSPCGAGHGLLLWFYSALVHPQANYDRGFGFPLRCIQEFALHGAYRCLGRRSCQRV